MTVTRVGLLALALTSGCLRFGYDATRSDNKPQPDAGMRDAGAERVDAGKRDAAASGNMDASGVQPTGGAGGSHAAVSGGAGGSGAGGAGGQGGSAAPIDEDAGMIDVNQKVGDTGLIVGDILGYYNNPAWGNMVLQAHGNEIWGVYGHDGGTVVGNIASDGLFTGWWSQTPTRTGMDAGEVQFTWMQGVGMPIRLTGVWRYQTSGSWITGWDLTRITDSSPPSSLTDVFNQPDQFRRHP